MSDILNTLLEYQNTIITVVFCSFMLLFTYQDHQSYKNKNHKDYQSTIVGIGVLGTFIGIFIGLYSFDTSNIKESIPLLLDGLKVAFVTSIIGMFLSIILSVLQKSEGHGEIEDELQALIIIGEKLDKLSILDKIDTKLNNLDFANMEKTMLILSKEVLSIKGEMGNNQTKLFNFLKHSLDDISNSLDKAINQLSSGATDEIIKALEKVIQDFNNNLTEQFGENFKQLNESVKNMIIWQENYKNSIQKLEIGLNASIKSISSTDAKLSNMTNNYNKIDITHNKLIEIIKSNDVQVKELEIHLKSLAKVGEKAQLMTSSIDEFGTKIKDSLSSQSQTLDSLIKDNGKLSKDLQEQLPKSLRSLNRTLSSLTNKFRDDYEAFLQYIHEIMQMNNTR